MIEHRREGSILCIGLIVFLWNVLSGTLSIAQQLPSIPITGGTGILWLSQFANPGLLGALYGTPLLPLTGFYPLYPVGFTPAIDERELRVGPIRLHPSLGLAEMYTDNVFRTDTQRKQDFFHTVAPGLQAQFPIRGGHLFLLDYRSNFQFYERNPSNDVRDQTASGRMSFRLPIGWNVDFQGEHKVGHDPRGSAVDIQALEVNRWNADRFIGQAEYLGAKLGISLSAQTIRWNYLNNNQSIIRDRLSHYAGLTLLGKVMPKTYGLLSVSAAQEIYDQNKNLDNVIYTVTTGARWNITGKTNGEIQVGYQRLQFSNARRIQSGPELSFFMRDRDAVPNFFISGTFNWQPTPRLGLSLQPYRTIQQTVISGTLLFVATGANLGVTYDLTSRTALTLNLGYERDDFQESSLGLVTISRSDTLKNVAVGLTYQPLRWIGASLQYVFEDRQSSVQDFSYLANTFMVSVQTLF